jgi:hypothetical protein
MTCASLWRQTCCQSIVTRFIFEHPARYRLVNSVREDYPAFYAPLEYYVFQIQGGAIRGD